MRGDFSAWRHERGQNFNGVLHQQGRVLLDADWNAQTKITNDWEDTAGRDIIGAGVAGVPADAPLSFKVKAAMLTGGKVDLTVAPGRIWADGLLAYLDGTADVHRIATYLAPPIQTPQFSAPVTPVPAGTRDAVILEVWREEINGFQLPNLLIEPALGGPDTTERVHTEMAFRLFRLTDSKDTCESIIDKLRDNFTAKGGLTVKLEAPPPPTGDCPLVQGSGYTGFEHNLYRIEIASVATGIAPMFKWSQFGGGLVGRGHLQNTTITIGANQQAIINSGLPKFYMEIISYDPEPLAATGLGHWKVAYGANVTLGSNGTLTLPSGSAGVFFGTPPPSGNIFFRLWNGIALISEFDGPDALPLQDGILLKFDVASSLPNYVAGDYWTFPVRAGEIANTPPLIDHQPPAGIHYHRVPLGIIEWTVVEIEDCRRIFQPLTRLATCCTYRVGDGMHSHGDFRSIQAAVNALPADGGEVCVLPGVYNESVVVNERRNIIIKGCGTRTRVVSPAGVDGAEGAPVFHVKESQNIQILSLAAEAQTGVGILLQGRPKEDIPKNGSNAPLLNITLENLLVRAAERSAIEVKVGYNITIRRCRIEMNDQQSEGPGVFFIGEDSLIEANEILVPELEDRVRGLDWDSPLDASFAEPAQLARGGLQLGGGCERIRVINNVIARGMESGIILGSLQTISTTTGQRVPKPPRTHFCSPCRGGDNSIPTKNDDDPETRSTSEGDLYEILIERNRIFNMGMNGITVAGFFELEESREFVTVHGLVIDRNVIRKCLSRELEVIDPKMLDKIGYGGIALSHVEQLVIRDNFIEDNGPNQLEPICGIFVLHGEGIEISRNWILNNGAKPLGLSEGNPAQRAKLGQRGGINIVNCMAPLVDIKLNSAFNAALGIESLPTQYGVPAIKVHDNVVSVPLGQALKVTALGAVSVAGNQFTSRGMVLNTASPSYWASTVMIMNLGTSKEFIAQLVTHETIRNNQVGSPRYLTTGQTAAGASGDLAGASVFGRRLVNGNVLFNNNQCALDLLEAGFSFALSSILISSFDDVGFHNNQCDCNLLDDTVLTDAWLFGTTLRASNNRFKEGYLNTMVSAVTTALLNITTDNESTHCLLVQGAKKLRRHNVVLLSLWDEEVCSAFEFPDDDDCDPRKKR